MTLLVFGKTGQLAQALKRLAPGARFLSRLDVDLTRPEDCANAIRESDASVVINATAYTAVDRAEAEPEVARLVNADAPRAMAKAAAQKGVPLLHVSTDYVFDGTGDTARKPDDEAAPLGVYGRTKREGELGVLSANGQNAILRTSWVFSAHGANFVKTMLRLGAERDALNVVADQVGGPTEAGDIAAALLSMASKMIDDPALGGVHHFAGTPTVSWAEFARAIFASAGLDVAVTEIPSSAFPTAAERPKNSRLDGGSLADVFGIKQPDWRVGLERVLDELGQLK